MKVLVTGAAGFIGSKIASILAERGDEVVGIDNINDYYDIRLKFGHLGLLGIGRGMVDLEWKKEYRSEKNADGTGKSVTLYPLNKDYSPIELSEDDDVSEGVDAAQLGDILHHAICSIYAGHEGKRDGRLRCPCSRGRRRIYR